MIEVFRGKTFDGQVPPGNNHYKQLYSNVQYVFGNDGSLCVLVPEEEVKVSEDFCNKSIELLKELEKEHSVLAKKLARVHHFILR